jgi:signal transduction histidine kinase
MGKTEIILILSIITAVIFIFIAGILMFVNQYRNRLRLNEQEKIALEKQHKLDLLNNQLNVQQQTMQFIGNEIHDSVAQKLTLATLYTQKLEYENNAPAISSRLAEIGTIINESLEELRDLSRTLSNSNIQDKQLSELLDTECKKINAAGICRIESGFNCSLPMSFIVKSSLLRVIQEFIQNSLKHSGCKLIRISFNERSDGLSGMLSDNGKGFDSDDPGSRGIGLNNIQRRMHFIGGTAVIKSKIGYGTTLELFLSTENLIPQ